jgi:hypothetical protein
MKKNMKIFLIVVFIYSVVASGLAKAQTWPSVASSMISGITKVCVPGSTMTFHTTSYNNTPGACFQIWNVYLEYSSTSSTGPFTQLNGSYTSTPFNISYNQTSICDISMPNANAAYVTGWYRTKVNYVYYYDCNNTCGNCSGSQYTLAIYLTFNKPNAGPDKWIASCCGCATVGTPAIPGATYLWTPGNSNLAQPCYSTINTYTMAQTINSLTCYDQVRVTWNSFISCCRMDDHNAGNEYNSSDIQLFPNPNNGTFIVTGLTVGDLVSVTNLTGQEVYQNLITNNVTGYEIDLGQIPQGIYLLKVKNPQNLVIRKFSIDN